MMKPPSNKINVTLLIADIIMIAVTTYLRSSLGTSGYFTTLFILLLALISVIVAIRGRLNWDWNQEYQRNAGSGKN